MLLQAAPPGNPINSSLIGLDFTDRNMSFGDIEADKPESGPRIIYDPVTYPFLGTDFFDGDQVFPVTEDRYAHIHEKEAPCPSCEQTKRRNHYL